VTVRGIGGTTRIGEVKELDERVQGGERCQGRRGAPLRLINDLDTKSPQNKSESALGTVVLLSSSGCTPSGGGSEGWEYREKR
jgi:hypothetical protein